MANQHLIEVENLKMYFKKVRGVIRQKVSYVKAVDNVSFFIDRGETFGLVGESGCGKTTTGRAISRLYEPTDGTVRYDGADITHLSAREFMAYRKKIQMIFQDPYASLNPRMTVGIARALAVCPEFIICDEPISALDVSIQAQVINMLEDLQEQMGLTYLFVAHDLSMVRHISDRVGVMYLGSLVEIAETEELYNHNQHPYTKALLSAIPVADPDLSRQSRQILLEGDVPSPLNSPAGCKFASRCPHAKDVCRELAPVLKETHKGHFVACHLVEGQ